MCFSYIYDVGHFIADWYVIGWLKDNLFIHSPFDWQLQVFPDSKVNKTLNIHA